jgi:hypothetical protein
VEYFQTIVTIGALVLHLDIMGARHSQVMEEEVSRRCEPEINRIKTAFSYIMFKTNSKQASPQNGLADKAGADLLHLTWFFELVQIFGDR